MPDRSFGRRRAARKEVKIDVRVIELCQPVHLSEGV